MADIFNISNYSSATSYSKNDVVNSNSTYWYSLTDANANNTPALSSTYWGGYTTDPIDGQTKPEFIWLSSYGMNINISPRIQRIQFGQGYSQNIADGINSSLLMLDLQFDGRDIKETLAIIHFLYQRNGVETFLYTCPAPFSRRKRFKCQEFPMSINFYQNNTIACKFEEVPV